MPTLSANVDLADILGGTQDLWVGWTGANDFAWNAHEVITWQMETFSDELGLATETIDVTDHLGLLQPGENVVALHVLNADISDSDLLIDVTLTASEFGVTSLDKPQYFTNPTPGGLNGVGAANAPLSPVGFSVTGGTFANPFQLELIPPSPAASIRYTTDGVRS